MTTARAILQSIESLAPPTLAEGWDNVGLLVGDGGQPVTRVLVALDASAPVLAQAAEHDAQLLVVHHPLIFSGLKRLTEDGGIATLVRRLVREGRGLIAAHTNLDSAPRGLNTYVAGMLGLAGVRPLAPTSARPLLKLVVYVPESHAEAVRKAICGAGAGHIGQYRDCTFSAPGTGTFTPEAGTRPFVGSPGTLERVAEVRLETVVPKAALGGVISAMLAAHPYEEVAYDLFALENAWPDAGLGCIGTLERSTTAGAFLQRVQETLNAPLAKLAGDPAQPVSTVALLTGSGGDFAEAAARAGADLFLTGEVKHHQALLARQQGLALIDAGHYTTERPAVALLASHLRAAFPALEVVEAVEEDAWAG